MNQSNNNHANDRKKFIIKTTVIILVAIIAWAGFNALVQMIAKKANQKSAANSMTGQHCISLADYKKRVKHAFTAYSLARQALITEIRMARYMSSPPASAEYSQLNEADMTTARRDDEFSKLVRVNGKFKQDLACHQGKDAAEVKRYLFALTNLTIADNLLYQVRGEISAKCNPKVSAYMPYINFADQAVDMARKDISGKIKAQGKDGYIAKMPKELSNMKAIQDLCH